MSKKLDDYFYTYDELRRKLDSQEDAMVVTRYVCPWGEHRWRLETMGPDVFMAVCEKCGKRTMNPSVLLKLLDDFSY